jgi:thiol-disulfide isomerase/thioredoxin
MRHLTTALLSLTLGASAFAAMPVPRQSKEFTFVQPDGKQILLSSLKGKVVVIQFLYTTCPHCQALSKELTKLSAELGPNVQMMGVAFEEDDQNQPKEAMAAANYVRNYGVSFPVGYATRDTVMSYLGLSVMDRFVVPQVAIIDKKGVVQAQSAPMGTTELQTPDYLRSFIKKLEGGGAGVGKSTTPAKPATPVASNKKTT